MLIGSHGGLSLKDDIILRVCQRTEPIEYRYRERFIVRD